MVTAYLGGPMRRIKDFNFPAFLDAGKKLRALGYKILSPAEREISRGYDCHGHDGDPKKFSESTGFNLRKALKRDLKWICEYADMVIVLPGWEHSKGTRAEVATATAIGLPVVPLETALKRYRPYQDDYLIIDPLRMPFRDFQAISDVDQHLDKHCGKPYQDQPLAQDWARVAKAAEEAGEAVKAFINYTGQNPRKGKCGTIREVQDELADTAFASIFAIQHFTKDVDATADVLEEALQKAVKRIEEMK